MSVIGQRFYANALPVSVNDLVETLQLPKQSIEDQLILFEIHGLLVRADSDTLAYVPAQPLEELTLKTVIDTVRKPSPTSHIKSSLNQKFPTINELLNSVDKKVDNILGNKTIKQMVKDENNFMNEFLDSAVTPIATGRENKNE